ncbi:MAG: Beta-galactosidase C-terminal domain, partial [Bacteroides sp.]|nr:Beta-galactosidase C-terminal domain [Bacteroides sp.]
LWWDGLSFADESTNPIVGGKETFPVAFNQDLNDFYKKMIAIRKNNLVFSNGGLEYLKAEGDILVYRRSNDDSVIDVYFNNGNQPIEIDVYMEGKSLITEKEYTESMVLEPLSFEIIKIK